MLNAGGLADVITNDPNWHAVSTNQLIMSEIQVLDARAFPFLSEVERKDYVNDTAQAESLNTERYNKSQEAVRKSFVEQARDFGKFAERKNQDVMEQYATFEKETGSGVVALDMLLYNQPALRSELNALRKNAPVDYSLIASAGGDAELARYYDECSKYNRVERAATGSTDDPGQGATLQQTVSQSIMYRVDNFAPVVQLVSKVNIPYGNYAATIYNKYGLAGYITEDAAIPDNTANLTDATDGIDKVEYSGKEFGTSFNRTWLSSKRISASVINQQMTFTEQEIGRGKALQILSGTGVGLNDSGIITVASPADAGATLLDTFSNAIAECNNANAFTLSSAMNAKAWNELRKLSSVSDRFGSIINVNNQTVWGVPVTVVSEDVMPTAANVAKVVVGDFSHYIDFMNGGFERINLQNTSTAAMITMFLMARDGGVLFADSFSTFDVTVI